MTIEIIFALSLLTVCLGTCLFSIRKLKREMVHLRQRIPPVGWKYLAEGPELQQPLTAEMARLLNPLTTSKSVIIHFSPHCPACELLKTALPAFVEDYPDVGLAVISPVPYQFETRSISVRFFDDRALAIQLALRSTPFAIYLEEDVPMRKGLVNNLEQLRLLVEPLQVSLDMQFK